VNAGEPEVPCTLDELALRVTEELLERGREEIDVALFTRQPEQLTNAGAERADRRRKSRVRWLRPLGLKRRAVDARTKPNGSPLLVGNPLVVHTP
jgi:hypothetical protein